ncbi:MAG: QueT transporter family protein [Oscillospiraceae bacterium]|nr:QueT transporter family protein [Oscillospiraceae bacterium]
MHIRKIVFAGAIGAIYAALTFVVAPISYGPIQFRISEALCILPFFSPITSAGLFVGCLIANLLSPYGLLDIVAGSFATLLAALMTMQLGRINRRSPAIKALACFPPVIINALFIGAVIAWAETSGSDAFQAAFALNGLQVGLGQLVVMYAIGLPLMFILPKSSMFKKVFDTGTLLM